MRGRRGMGSQLNRSPPLFVDTVLLQGWWPWAAGRRRRRAVRQRRQRVRHGHRVPPVGRHLRVHHPTRSPCLLRDHPQVQRRLQRHGTSLQPQCPPRGYACIRARGHVRLQQQRECGLRRGGILRQVRVGGAAGQWREQACVRVHPDPGQVRVQRARAWDHPTPVHLPRPQRWAAHRGVGGGGWDRRDE